jgi:YVTN family beta-propeller protein
VKNVGNYDVIGSISIVDITTNNVTATVPVEKSPGGLAITPDGSKVYVANTVSNSISVIDTATNKVTDTVNVGSTPIDIAI